MGIRAIIARGLMELGAMDDLNDVQYFAAVVEHQGFSAAARALNLPKSSVSRRVANLRSSPGRAPAGEIDPEHSPHRSR